MVSTLTFPTPQALADVATLVRRAKAINDEGIRIQAVGATAAFWVGVLHGQLGSSVPTIIGMRAVALAEPATVDTVVALRSLQERFAHMGDDSSQLPLPPTTMEAAWAAVSPPRGGWQACGVVDVARLKTEAQILAAEIKAALPEQPGQAIVNTTRAALWAETFPAVGRELPRGAALAADALGFLPAGSEEGKAKVTAAGAWLRLSCPAGEILIKNYSQ